MICVISNKLMLSDQLINTWAELFNSNKDKMLLNINQIKNYDKDFDDKIFNSKILNFEESKKYINGLNNELISTNENLNNIKTDILYSNNTNNNQNNNNTGTQSSSNNNNMEKQNNIPSNNIG